MEDNQTPKQRRTYKRNPCRNCLSFPICLAVFKETEIKKNISFNSMSSSVRYIFGLTKKCSLLNDYTLEEKVHYDNRLKYRSFYRVEVICKHFRYEVYKHDPSRCNKTKEKV